MLMICLDGWTDEVVPDETLVADSLAWVEEMDRRGIRKSGSRLRPTSDAITLRTRDGEVLISDGPFAETKEQIAGFDLIECADLDEAIEVAAKHPAAKFGLVEVRPLWEM
jgi:hypothetical protein